MHIEPFGFANLRMNFTPFATASSFCSVRPFRRNEETASAVMAGIRSRSHRASAIAKVVEAALNGLLRARRRRRSEERRDRGR